MENFYKPETDGERAIRLERQRLEDARTIVRLEGLVQELCHEK
jgi:hypothetical protein